MLHTAYLHAACCVLCSLCSVLCAALCCAVLCSVLSVPCAVLCSVLCAVLCSVLCTLCALCCAVLCALCCALCCAVLCAMCCAVLVHTLCCAGIHILTLRLRRCTPGLLYTCTRTRRTPLSSTNFPTIGESGLRGRHAPEGPQEALCGPLGRSVGLYTPFRSNAARDGLFPALSVPPRKLPAVRIKGIFAHVAVVVARPLEVDRVPLTAFVLAHFGSHCSRKEVSVFVCFAHVYAIGWSNRIVRTSARSSSTTRSVSIPNA